MKMQFVKYFQQMFDTPKVINFSIFVDLKDDIS